MAIDIQKAEQFIDQTVDRRRAIFYFILFTPAVQTTTIALVLFEGRGIEHANCIVVYAYRFSGLRLFIRMPVKCVHILQDGEYVLAR